MPIQDGYRNYMKNLVKQTDSKVAVNDPNLHLNISSKA